ncbi:HipA domain-containing protein [Candidatus Palauibacter sp.]|uniref:HipA domain-containing protein n=1 Tax=Candidatus Palauibacter sp. TaxID=3101350 RepID=UPI003B5BDB8C
MPESYPVVEVDPEWVGPEGMGTKQKFWYRKADDQGPAWLFKYPQPNTGQHWAEKIAAEIAHALDIGHARVELAEFDRRRGSVSESFALAGAELVHGNQILAWTVAGYDRTVRFGQSDHSFKNIWTSFERIFQERTAAEDNRTAFAEYMVLDVIGNTDRHHENWGLLRSRDGDEWRGVLAPSFDHASSLGRELLDERRALLLNEERVDRYSERGRGGIYWSGDARYGPSPLTLVRAAAERHGSCFRGILDRVAELPDSLVTELVRRVPTDWMSETARAFVINLIRYNRNQLRELVR